MSTVIVRTLTDKDTGSSVRVEDLVSASQEVSQKPTVYSSRAELPAGTEGAFALVIGEGLLVFRGGEWRPSGMIPGNAHPLAQQWAAAHLSLGLPTPDADRIMVVSRLHRSLDQAGLSGLVDVLYFLAGFRDGEELSVRINLMDPGSYTLVPSGDEDSRPTWTPGVGTSGRGEVSFDTGYSPASDSLGYSLNSGHLCAVNMSMELSSNNTTGEIGFSNSLGAYLSAVRQADNTGGYRINSSGNRFYTYPNNASGVGIHLVSRTSSEEMAGSLDGYWFSSANQPVTAVPSGTVVIHRTSGNHSPRTCALASCGSGMNQEQMEAYASIIQAFLVDAGVFQ